MRDFSERPFYRTPMNGCFQLHQKIERPKFINALTKQTLLPKSFFTAILYHTVVILDYTLPFQKYYLEVGQYRDVPTIKNFLDVLTPPNFADSYLAPALKEAMLMLKASKRYNDRNVGKAIILIIAVESTDRKAASKEVNFDII